MDEAAKPVFKQFWRLIRRIPFIALMVLIAFATSLWLGFDKISSTYISVTQDLNSQQSTLRLKESELNQRDLELTKRKLELDSREQRLIIMEQQFTDKRRTYEQELATYHSDSDLINLRKQAVDLRQQYLSKYADIDLHSSPGCDPERQAKYHQADALMDALYTIAKQLGDHNEYHDFVTYRRGNITSYFEDVCDNKEQASQP